MTDETWRSYSPAQALRCGGPSQVREALLRARGRTLALAQAYSTELHATDLRIDYNPNLNPPLWEWGHLAWFQEFWVGRNQERDRGIACRPDHPRLPSLLEHADRLFDSSRVAH